MEYVVNCKLGSLRSSRGMWERGPLRVNGLKGGERREKKREVDWRAESIENLDVLRSGDRT
jgi:hypothetical protein